MKIKPMLAYKVDAKPIDWSENVFMQPKLDGVRCIIQTDDQGKVIAYSRTGKPWLNINHILKDLKPFFDQQPDVILDGELYNHDLRDDFEQIISLVRTQKPSPYVRSKSKKLVQFHCYDYANGSDSYKTRMDNLAVASFYSYCVKYVPTSVVYHYNHAQLKHQAFLERGYEGSILRLNKPYEQKRSYSLQKFKDFHDAEATIIGYVKGKGKRTGTLGKFIMKDDEGIEFGCPPGKGFNYKDLTKILNNIDDYIGQRATFTYFERTKANSYRHPMFKTLRNYE
jgi:DNA ligase-1|tara:strand:- start:373 stop:1218 length:846 start_codon:yes stop_codon:yes gene_type:complete